MLPAVKIVVKVSLAEAAIVAIRPHMKGASSEIILFLFCRKSISHKCASVVVFWALMILILRLGQQITLLFITKTINEIAGGDCEVFYLIAVMT